MKMNLKHLRTALLTAFLAVLAVACKKDDDDGNRESMSGSVNFDFPTYAVAGIQELEPLRQESNAPDDTDADGSLPENQTDNPENNPSGQMALF